jgi:hypothetical protein
MAITLSMLVEWHGPAICWLPGHDTWLCADNGSSTVKKGRHRRFEEARALKRLENDDQAEPCAECGAEPGADHASWCLAMEDLDDDENDSETEEAEVHRA